MKQKTEINKANGQRLRGFRKQNSLKMEELSKILNRTPRMINYYENGIKPIPQIIIEQLNEHYHLGLINPNIQKVKNKQKTISVLMNQLLKAVKELNEVVMRIK